MAYPLNRALLACSVSALALALVSLYYWQLRKRRKSISDCSDDSPPHVAPVTSATIVDENTCCDPSDTTDKIDTTLLDCANLSTHIVESNFSVCENDEPNKEAQTENTVDVSVSEVIEETSQPLLNLHQFKQDNDSFAKIVESCHLSHLSSIESVSKEENSSITITEPHQTKVIEHCTTETSYNMQLKSTEPLSPSLANSPNDCVDGSALVSQLKSRLSSDDSEIETNNVLKVSSIDLDSISSDFNKIVTIQVEQKPNIDKSRVNGFTPAVDTTIKDENNANESYVSNQEESNMTSDDKINTEVNMTEKIPTNNNSSSTATDGSASSGKQVSLSAGGDSIVVNGGTKMVQTFAQVLSKKGGNTSQPIKVDTSSPTSGECSPQTGASPSDLGSCVGQYSPSSGVFVESEGSQDSNDSGHECSTDLHQGENINGEEESNAYQIVNVADDQVICFQFEMPFYLCGKLIGANGHFINSVKERSNTQIVVNAHFFSNEYKICSITGKKSNVIIALDIIRRKFPLKNYPNVTLKQINVVSQPVPTIPLSQACQLHLHRDISTDVIISSTINPGHFFLQQPTHPSYPQLNHLDNCMRVNYSQANAPTLPQPVYKGLVCAAPYGDGWYRALIKQVSNDSSTECDIMFVDYGGYSYNVPVASLRQIRFDFMSLPFQASECYLSDVVPIDAEIGWTPEANAFFEKIARGEIIYAIIMGYAEDGIPFVNLVKVQGNTRIFINRELVEHGHARWVEQSEHVTG